MRTKLPEPVPVVSAAFVDAKWRLPDGKTSKTQGSSHWNRSLELEHTNISPFSARNVLAGNPTLHVMPPRAINSPVYGFIRHHVLSQTSRQFITTSLCDLNNIPIRIIKWLFTFLNTWFFIRCLRLEKHRPMLTGFWCPIFCLLWKPQQIV